MWSDERVRQSEQHIRTLVDSVKAYAIFMLSPQGTVVTWNQGAERLKGYHDYEIIGQSFERFYPPQARAAGRPATLLAMARADGRVEEEGWRIRKDGSPFWADVVITALINERGELTGYVKVTRDLTERRQIEQERATRLAAERAAERIRRLQVATAALGRISRPRDAADILAEAGKDALGAHEGIVAFPTPAGDGLEVVPAGDSAGHEHQPTQLPEPMLDSWRSAQPVYADCFAAVPLIVQERVVAVLGLVFETPRLIDQEHRGFLRALAEVAAQAIDRAEAHESERRARAEAEAAVAAQNEFLSIASHELRTPVTAIKAIAQLLDRALERGRFQPEYVGRHLNGIERATDRLGSLIEDLLDVSRLRTGQLKLRCEPLDVAPLVSEIVARYRATGPQRQFRLDVRGDKVLIQADPLRVEQVLDNLLSNAVKYSPSGDDVEVTVCQAADGATLHVTDHGIGLPPGHETRIFEVFGRAPNAAARQIPGLGLGLSICRELVEAHGGRIWATSPGEHQGSTVSVWLPAAR